MIYDLSTMRKLRDSSLIPRKSPLYIYLQYASNINIVCKEYYLIKSICSIWKYTQYKKAIVSIPCCSTFSWFILVPIYPYSKSQKNSGSLCKFLTTFFLLLLIFFTYVFASWQGWIFYVPACHIEIAVNLSHMFFS